MTSVTTDKADVVQVVQSRLVVLTGALSPKAERGALHSWTPYERISCLSVKQQWLYILEKYIFKSITSSRAGRAADYYT